MAWTVRLCQICSCRYFPLPRQSHAHWSLFLSRFTSSCSSTQSTAAATSRSWIWHSILVSASAHALALFAAALRFAGLARSYTGLFIVEFLNCLLTPSYSPHHFCPSLTVLTGALSCLISVPCWSAPLSPFWSYLWSLACRTFDCPDSLSACHRGSSCAQDDLDQRWRPPNMTSKRTCSDSPIVALASSKNRCAGRSIWTSFADCSNQYDDLYQKSFQ